MPSEDKTREGQDKLAQQDERIQRVRQKLGESSPGSAVKQELRREVREKGASQAARDNIKALKQRIRKRAQ